jgi:hypothetical protein
MSGTARRSIAPPVGRRASSSSGACFGGRGEGFHELAAPPTSIPRPGRLHRSLLLAYPDGQGC